MNAQVAQKIGHGPKKVMVIHGWFGPSVCDGCFQDFDLNAYEFAIVHNPGYGVAKGSAPSADSPKHAAGQSRGEANTKRSLFDGRRQTEGSRSAQGLFELNEMMRHKQGYREPYPDGANHTFVLSISLCVAQSALETKLKRLT